MLEDAILLWRFKQGSVSALERICRKYNAYLLKVACALMGNYHEAEDVLQDFFTSFLQSGSKIKLRGNLKSYMAVCVSNMALNRIKRRQIEPQSQSQMPESLTDLRTPQWLAEQTEQSVELTEALSKLPFEQREVIVLHLHADMKFAQIAALRNVSINTIAGRYRYGLDKLRPLLEREAINE